MASFLRDQRIPSGGLLCLLFTLVLVLPCATAEAPNAATDPTVTRAIFYAAWREGAGVLAFQSNTSEVHPAAFTIEHPPEYLVANLCTAHCEMVGPALEFVSAPLGRTLYLNVTQCIIFNFVTIDNNGWRVSEATLSVDGVMIAGWSSSILANAPFGASRSGCPNVPYPSASPLMHAQKAVIPKGAHLLLSVRTEGAPPFRLGLNGNPSTRVIIPVFSAEEAFFRIPELQGLSALENSEGPADLLGGSLLLVPLAAVLGRRPGTPTALLVLGLLVSGCTGAKPQHANVATGERGSISETIVPDPEHGVADERSGAVLGLIRDEYNAPVPKARVILIEPGNFTDTSTHGFFRFLDVPPGTHSIRVEKNGFHVFSGRLKVQPAAVTRVDLTMDPLERRTAFAPHPHDLWRGASTIKAFDADLPGPCASHVSQPYDAVFGQTCRNAITEFLLPETREGGVPNIVLPGTYGVDVNVTFEGPQAPGSVGLVVLFGSDPVHWRVLPPRPSGGTFHILSGWEMSDNGHATLSAWRFTIIIPRNDPYAATGHAREDWSYHVRVALNRGVVPLEVGHPDRWRGNETFSVVRDAVLQGYVGGSVLTGGATCWPAGTAPGPIMPAKWNGRILSANLALVPYGTEVVEVRVNQSRLANPVTEWVLTYKPANRRTWDDPLTAGERERNQLTTTWRIPMSTDPAHTVLPDGAYEAVTRWEFRVAPEDPDAMCRDSLTSLRGATFAPVCPYAPCELKLTLSATALRGNAAASG